MKQFSYLSMLTVITLSSFTLKDNNFVKEYLSIPGPIALNKAEYNLSWSSHPTDNYYKQEYLPADQKSETYTKMVMIETVIGEISLQDAVKAKINELEERKPGDAVTNYQVIENKDKGEYLLDFVLSASSNKMYVVEWNAYRYMKLKDRSGKTGIVLFAYSRRSYGNATSGFLKALKTERLNDINYVANFKMPEIKIK